jgi:hypothetical protein
MKLFKLDVMLCLALQEEGPFNVKITYSDHVEWKKLSKQEIDQLSDIDEVSTIEICLPRRERRWRNRGKKERRNG